MELQASRLAARTGPDGEIILLVDQDRGKWDRPMIRLGLESLERARATARTQGPYLLQAEIAACHARAPSAETVDWERIVAAYELLARARPSPIVELNRAVAVSMASGPAAALPLVDALADEPALRNYHLLPSVRGDLLFRLGRFAEARRAFEAAAGLASNAPERAFLLRRSAECEEHGGG
jgi:predicted RNA polymerase sigma factor